MRHPNRLLPFLRRGADPGRQQEFRVCCLALFAAAAALAGTLSYTYDDAGRLAKVDYGDGRAITYTYDNAGNLLRREITAPDSSPTSAAKKRKLPSAPRPSGSGAPGASQPSSGGAKK